MYEHRRFEKIQQSKFSTLINLCIISPINNLTFDRVTETMPQWCMGEGVKCVNKDIDAMSFSHMMTFTAIFPHHSADRAYQPTWTRLT